MTAKEILLKKAAEYNDGFTSGQIKWIVEAMEEYAFNQFLQENKEQDFWLKIRMKDHLWHDMDDILLNQLDDFEKQLNDGIQDKFLKFLRSGYAEIKVKK